MGDPHRVCKVRKGRETPLYRGVARQRADIGAPNHELCLLGSVFLASFVLVLVRLLVCAIIGRALLLSISPLSFSENTRILREIFNQLSVR